MEVVIDEDTCKATMRPSSLQSQPNSVQKPAMSMRELASPSMDYCCLFQLPDVGITPTELDDEHQTVSPGSTFL